MKASLKEWMEKASQYLFKCERRTMLWSVRPSTFPAQTLLMDLSEYDFVDIVVNQTGPGSVTAVCRCKVGSNSALYIPYNNPNTATDAAHMANTITRTANVTPTGITFSSGQMIYNGSAFKDWDNRCIPEYIYGIKMGGYCVTQLLQRLQRFSHRSCLGVM